ncbi:MAG: glycosyl hydrolase [Lachnospiraceae bacterium]|nr:glycosyl hydrolase [Lachnospiraceae bacterium]
MNRKLKAICTTACIAGILLAGCESNTNNNEVDDQAQADEAQFTPSISLIYQAEEAVFTGNVKAVKNDDTLSGCTGTGYVDGFEEDTDACIFNVEIPETNFYDLNFVSASAGGEKYNYISVDGEETGTVYIEETNYSDSVLQRVYLTEGIHEIIIRKYWGWIYLDKLEITDSAPLDASIYEVTAPLCNPEASEEAKKLYSYLCDIYGTKILSGQTCDQGPYGKEIQVIKKTTGKTPAVLAMDFMDYSPSRAANGTQGHTTEYAIDFWNNGGIVAFHWHWTVPQKYITGDWAGSFYKDNTNIDLAKIMNGEDKEGYELLMSDIDVIAQQLKVLQEAKVPVLFRPLHEASGGWFWWGTAGPEAYKKLYIAMYDKLTKEYGLNNIIWVWNGQDADWYPGDEYVDIIGEDIYPGERVYASQISAYLNAAQNYATETKLVYMTENGCVFDPELAKRDGAMWGMFCTWQGDFVAKDMAIFSLSEKYTEESMLKKAYEDEDVITLEDLPDLKSYPIREAFE